MNTRGLSLDTIPPLFIPLRFFLTAPVFGMLAALLIIITGQEIWLTRWSPVILGLTHLLTLGFMLMVMMGALYQFIPAILGFLIPGTRQFAWLIHILLTIGILSLSLAFIINQQWLYLLALISLGVALIIFLTAMTGLLLQKQAGKDVVFVLRMVAFALIMVLALGLYMLTGYSLPETAIIYRLYTDIHAIWGLAGWTLLLIMAVSSQVIPMFYVIPAFSVYYLKGLSIAIVITLLMLTFSLPLWVRLTGEVALAAELLFFSLYTLLLIAKRKRVIADMTINCWKLSLVCLTLAIILFWLLPVFHLGNEQQQLILGILLIYGFAITAIVGMMQKIVPFLIFLHLQRLTFKRPTAITLIPNMKNIITTKNSQIQFYLQFTSLVLILVAIIFPFLTTLSGILMLVNFLWLGYCLLVAIRIYQVTLLKIKSVPELNFGLAI